jgi:hypothetical protein
MQLDNQQLLIKLQRAIVYASYLLIKYKEYGFVDKAVEVQKDIDSYLVRSFVLQNIDLCNMNKDLVCEYLNIKEEYMNLCNESNDSIVQELEQMINERIQEILPCAQSVCSSLQSLDGRVTELESNSGGGGGDSCDCEAIEQSISDLEGSVSNINESLGPIISAIEDLQQAPCCIDGVTIEEASVCIGGTTYTFTFNTIEVVDPISGTKTFLITPTINTTPGCG